MLDCSSADRSVGRHRVPLVLHRQASPAERIGSARAHRRCRDRPPGLPARPRRKHHDGADNRSPGSEIRSLA
jgi:hypothetical protein